MHLFIGLQYISFPEFAVIRWHYCCILVKTDLYSSVFVRTHVNKVIQKVSSNFHPAPTTVYTRGVGGALPPPGLERPSAKREGARSRRGERPSAKREGARSRRGERPSAKREGAISRRGSSSMLPSTFKITDRSGLRH